MSHRITSILEPWIDAAVVKWGRGEKIRWEISLMPGPDGQPLIVAFFWLPGAVLGTQVNGSAVIPDPVNITEDQIDEMVQAFLTELRNARAAQTQQHPLGQQNGHPPVSGGGLILPGR